MLRYAVLLLAVFSAACTISPVLTEGGDQGGGRYKECRRAARDYCEDAVRAADDEMKKCVAEATYRCVLGGA